METFTTILACVYIIGYVLIWILAFTLFVGMNNIERSRTKIEVNSLGLLGFIIFISWLIYRIIQ